MLHRLLAPSMVSYSAAISACEKSKYWEDALGLLHEIPESGLSSPDGMHSSLLVADLLRAISLQVASTELLLHQGCCAFAYRRLHILSTQSTINLRTCSRATEDSGLTDLPGGFGNCFTLVMVTEMSMAREAALWWDLATGMVRHSWNLFPSPSPFRPLEHLLFSWCMYTMLRC